MTANTSLFKTFHMGARGVWETKPQHVCVRFPYSPTASQILLCSKVFKLPSYLITSEPQESKPNHASSDRIKLASYLKGRKGQVSVDNLTSIILSKGEDTTFLTTLEEHKHWLRRQQSGNLWESLYVADFTSAKKSISCPLSRALAQHPVNWSCLCTTILHG